MQPTPQDINTQILKKQAEWLSDFYTKVAEGGIPQHKEYSSTTASYNWLDDVDYGPDFTSDQEAWRVVFPPERVWVSEDGYIAYSIEEVDAYNYKRNTKFKEYVEVQKA